MSLLKTMFRRKSVDQLTGEDHEGPKLNKVLTWKDVFFHGVAAIIGTGIFVLTGTAAAGTATAPGAGPAIVLSFMLAGLVCAFVSYAYAEQSSMIPVSGSAYTYAYATLGEMFAWIIGWDLLLEYAVGASAVAVGWSAYLQNILPSLGAGTLQVLNSGLGLLGTSAPDSVANFLTNLRLPEVLSHAPTHMPWGAVLSAVALIIVGIIGSRKSFHAHRASSASGRMVQVASLGALLAAGVLFGLVNSAGILALIGAGVLAAAGATGTIRSLAGADARTLAWGLAAPVAGGLGLLNLWTVITNLTSVDLPAVLIIAFLNIWLIKGVAHTAKMTMIFVAIKVAVILLFIAVGVSHVEPANFVPFMPNGFGGVITGAAIAFFAYIGFDAVTTLSGECKDPQRDVPKGVIWSLVVCGLLYIVVAGIMVGALYYTNFAGGTESAAPMAKVMNHIGAGWASWIVSLGAMAGITSVLIVLLFGQSRIMMSMSRDGLIAPVFGKISARFQTPVWSILIWGIIIAATAGLLPISELAELTNIGTLAAFVMVCVGVIVLRVKEPNRLRKFRVPDYKLVPPVLGIASLVGIPLGMLLLPVAPWSVTIFGAVLALNPWLFGLGGFALTMGVMWYVQRRFGYPWIPMMGALTSFGLMLGLPAHTWERFVIWMALGVVIYFTYSRKHSRMNNEPPPPPSSPQPPQTGSAPPSNDDTH